MEHSQKALLPPLWSLQLSSLLTMKGGNFSQLNDYAMTHSACGECKHFDMQKKRTKQTLLITHSQLRLQKQRFAQVTNYSAWAGVYNRDWPYRRPSADVRKWVKVLVFEKKKNLLTWVKVEHMTWTVWRRDKSRAWTHIATCQHANTGRNSDFLLHLTGLRDISLPVLRNICLIRVFAS